ncbi:MAG: hypothetical protein JXN60_04695, partial [Lentisphaerae bacterium]|nr:hypothetical protein [Lentisphaerota bacterium]
MTNRKDSADSQDMSSDSSDALAALEMINRALAEVGDEESLTPQDEDSFEFSLTEALKLLPRRYVKESNLDELASDSIIITVPDLFKQLAKGKIAMPVSKLAYFVPANLMYDAAFNDENMVNLSLQSVVRAIGLEAFTKRLPSQVREYDIDGLPDPFKEDETVVLSLGSEEVATEMEKQTIWDAGSSEEEKPAEATTKDTAKTAPEKPAASEVKAAKPAIDQPIAHVAESEIKPEQPIIEKIVSASPVKEPVSEAREVSAVAAKFETEQAAVVEFKYPLKDASALLPVEYSSGVHEMETDA